MFDFDWTLLGRAVVLVAITLAVVSLIDILFLNSPMSRAESGYLLEHATWNADGSPKNRAAKELVRRDRIEQNKKIWDI